MTAVEELTQSVQPMEQPWETLSHHIKAGDGPAALGLIRRLPSSEALYALGRLKDKKLVKLWRLLIREDIAFAADLLEPLPDALAALLIERLPTELAAALLAEADSDERVDLLATMSPPKSEAVLAVMDPAEAAELQRNLDYAPDTAGGLMVNEILAFPESATVASVEDYFRVNHDKFDDYVTRYLFTRDDEGQFTGVVRSRRLLVVAADTKLSELRADDFATVTVDTPLEDLEALFDRVDHVAVPVVDGQGRLYGAVRRSAVYEALQEREAATLMRFGGIVGGEELRSMPIGIRTLRRLAFLMPSIALSYLAVSVIAIYEPVVEQVTALAVFLPMVANLSGAAGNQAVAVSIRELTLGLIEWRDLFRVWGKEILVGAINGLAVGAVLAVVIFLVRDDVPVLPLVVGTAYFLSSMLAVVLGGALPLVMTRLGIDPAMLSSPILTTLTDMAAFFLVLALAAAALNLGHITG
jgi:magnesium transporter